VYVILRNKSHYIEKEKIKLLIHMGGVISSSSSVKQRHSLEGAMTEFESLDDIFHNVKDAECGATIALKEGVHMDFRRERTELCSRLVEDPKSPVRLEPVSARFSSMFKLSRGGAVVLTTSMGAIQFGIPPESIKDCMLYGLEVPTYYVISGDMFDRDTGLSIAEFEFPIYFNYFVKKRKVSIFTTPQLKNRIRRAFQETLFGPAKEDLRFEQDFAPDVPLGARPNFVGEGEGLDPARKTLTLSDLLEFRSLETGGRETALGEEVFVSIRQKPNIVGEVESVYHIREGEEALGEVPVKVELRKRFSLSAPAKVFVAPIFGITVLGSSHGFDPKASTTGFVLWINRIGFMVDPPPNSSQLLEGMGIAPTMIVGIILTHCHADHDAGTFQKILRQRQVRLYTTTTIKDSFMRKYEAITGFSVAFLESLFEFREVQIGSDLVIGCARIHFFYSLHTIPCIGFQAVWNGSSIAYSADTNFSPELIESLHEANVIEEERKVQLLSFPWDSTIVLHEMGVPPIHTAKESLETKCKADPSLKERLFIVHSAKQNSEILNQAEEMDTFSIPLQRCSSCVRMEVLELLRAQFFFRPIHKNRSVLLELTLLAEYLEVEPGTIVVNPSDPIDTLWIVMTGVAEKVVERDSGGHLMQCLHVTASIGENGITHRLEEDYISAAVSPDGPGSLAHRSTWGNLKASPTFGKGFNNLLQSDTRSSGTIGTLYGFRVIAKSHMNLVGFKIDRMVEILRNSRSGNVVCESLRLSSLDVTAEALELIATNSKLQTILDEQLCIEEFLKLLRKTRFKKDEVLPESVVIAEGVVCVEFQTNENSEGEKEHDGLVLKQLFPSSGSKKTVSRGTLIGDVSSIYKGEKSRLKAIAETDGIHYVIPRDHFNSFLKSFPGFLVQLLDRPFIKA